MRKIVLLGQEKIKLCALYQPTTSRLAVPDGDKTQSDIRVSRMMAKIKKKLGNTGAMRTAPMADIEALLNINSLHIQVKKEAFLSVLKLNQAAKFKADDHNEGHLRI